MTKIKKIICPRCTGNGYIRIPNKAVGFNEQVIVQCTMCNSEGEIDEVDRPSDGFNFDYSGIDADKLQ